MKGGGVRLGLVSYAGREGEEDARVALRSSGMDGLFEPDLFVHGGGASRELFERAARQAGLAGTPQRCLYVGEDRDERGYALQAGILAAPHPRLAGEVLLSGARLRYVRITVPGEHRGRGEWRGKIRELAVVPLHVTGEDGTRVYAIATSGAASRLDDLGFEVDRLGAEDEPLATEVYFLRDDRQVRSGFLEPEGESSRFFRGDGEAGMVLASAEGGLYVTLPAGYSVLRYHFEGALHGHTVKLLPGMGLLEPFGAARAEGWVYAPPAEPALDGDEVEVLRQEISPEKVSADVDRYSGTVPVDNDGGVTIRSRHVQHEHNAAAVAALLLDLEEIGGDDFSVGLHRFTEVTGEGSLDLDNVEAELEGELGETVLITAHLDSTAAFTDFEGREYDPDDDPAPGSDDDGSGVAGVLAAARAIKKLSAQKRPKRNIRFVLFNAEEEGLVGSGEYARDQAALGAPIVAVYQMDMIGYNRQPPRSYEIHAGADSRDVQDRSLALAERVAKLSEKVSPDLPAPQVYLNRGPVKDPAYNRSDHHSFHLVGYAACAASEDFFANPDSSPSEGNPNYHQTSDTFVDPEYTADIARAIVAAAWATANA